MITPKLSFEPRERTPYTDSHAYFHPAFFRGEMRRSWPKTLCYTLFLFFVLPLPLLFEASGHPNWSILRLSNSLTSMINNTTWAYCLATVAVALFAGMLATLYLCRRPSVDFYHSLPIRREGLLLQSWLCGTIQFCIALIFNVLLSMIILFSAIGDIHLIGTPIGKLMITVGYMLLTYLLFYTLTVFCGLLCGTSFMQIAVTGLVLGAYPLFRVLALAFCDMVTQTVQVSHYLDGNWGWTSPILRLIYLAQANDSYYMVDGVEYARYGLENPFAWWEILLWIVASVVLLLGAMWLYRKRHVERAGTPVVFEGVATAVKWVVIVLATMSMGWIFGEIGSGVAWILFGFLLGGLLSFMLINTILTKNPKQMFRGWRAIIIYLVAFCIGSVGIGYAVSEVEDIVPKKADRVEIYFSNDNFSVPYYTDPAVIAAWQALWEAEMQNERAGTGIVEAVTSVAYADKVPMETSSNEASYIFRERSISIRAYAQIGPFVIPYRIRNIERSAAEDLLRAVADSEEFEAGWDAVMSDLASRKILENNAWSDEYVNVYMLDLFGDLYRSLTGVSNDVNRLFIDSVRPLGEDVLAKMVAEQPKDIGFEFFQNPVYAYFDVGSGYRIRDDRLSYSKSNYYWYQYSVGMNESAIYRDVLGMSEAEFYDMLVDVVLEQYGGLYLARRVNGAFTLGSDNVIRITDRGQILEILSGMSLLDTDFGDRLSPFTVLDEDYAVFFSTQHSNEMIYFIKGRTPAFVPGLFN